MTPETERPLQHLRDKIEASYPNPIATAFRRYCDADSDNLTGRHKFLLDLFELFVKFLCAVQLSEGHGYVPNFSQALTEGARTLDFLKKPAVGHWVGLLRELCELDLKVAKPTWSQKISEWYNQPGNEASDLAVEQLSSRFNLAQTDGPPIAIICNSLVNPRNVFAHLPTATEAEGKATLFTLESVLAFVLESASFLSEGQLFVTRPTIRREDGRFRFRASVLKGINEREREFLHAELLEPDWVYLTNPNDHDLTKPVVPLTPFLLWQRGDEEKREQMFVLDKAEKNKLIYASFVTGKTHEERNSKLRILLADLTSPSFQADFDNSPYRHLRPSVRTHIAKTLYSQGLRLLDYRYFEQALKFMQDAAAAEKRPEILVSMASVMIELKEPLEEIKETLQQALDLDPTNKDAQRLIGNLTEYEVNGHRGRGSAFEELPLRKTVFHLFCPRQLRNHAITFWFTLIVGWYSASAITEFISGNPQRAVAMTLAMLCCLAVIFGGAILRPWAERLKTPLQRQLGEMREQRFNDWFDDQLRMIFESFSPHNSKTQTAERIRKILYAIGVVWMISMVGGALYFSQSYLAPMSLMLKRFVDYFVLFAVLYPAVQYTIAITLFVYNVSGLPLKPTLTKITNDGMRHLGPFVAFNIIFATLIYSLLHLSFAIGFTNPIRIDLVFLFVGTSIVAVWTIAFPFQLRQSLQASKNSSIVKYSGHVDDAFNKFVEDPSETNEGRYRRLIDNERIIQRISVWPLSAAETVFIIGGSNLLLVMVATAYFLHRLGLWTQVFGWFK